MSRFLLWVVVPSLAASAFLSVSGVFVAWLGGWWGVAAGFGASFIVALILGSLAWRDNSPVRRLLNVVKATDTGVEVRGDFGVEVPPDQLPEMVENIRRLAEIAGTDPDQALRDVLKPMSPP